MRKRFKPVDYSKDMGRLERTYVKPTQTIEATLKEEVPSVLTVTNVVPIVTPSYVNEVPVTAKVVPVKREFAPAPTPPVVYEEEEIEDDGPSF